MMLEDLISAGFTELGLPCPDSTLHNYRAYYEALEESNKVMNLTAIHGEIDVARLHFLDCAALLSFEDLTQKRVFDIGTGAGFPGLALKIACPSISLLLLDSLDKRIGFLRSVCNELSFSDVTLLHARAEEASSDYWEQADVVTSRAVAGLNVLAEMCLPFVQVGGVFLAMKGPEYEEELDAAKHAIHELGGKTEQCSLYTIPGTDISHSIIRIRKVSHTPKKYPRRWAQIKKSPL